MPEPSGLDQAKMESELVLQERLNAAQKMLTSKQDEIDRLQEQLSANYISAGADEELLREYTQNKLVTRALTREAELKTDRVVELEGSVENLRRELNRVNVGLSDMEKLFLNEQDLKNQVERQLAAINQKTQAAFEIADISKYLTGVINDFNASVNTGNAAVNYIIKELDIEMKAHIAKTEDSRLLMSAPSLAADSEGSLSLIRFSIGAVPKDIAASD